MSDDKRVVIIYKYEKKEGDKHYSKARIGFGFFHQFGMGYEEFDNGVGNFSTAIVEMPDGCILNVQTDLIVFTDTEKMVDS